MGCLLKVKKKIILNALCQLAVGFQFAEFPNPDQLSSVHSPLGVGAWSLSVIAARWRSLVSVDLLLFGAEIVKRTMEL